MSIQNYRFYKYICFTAICGAASSLLAVVCWYLISGVNLMEWILDVVAVFITCWCVGGVFSMFLYTKLHNLALFTYLFSIVILAMITIYSGEWNDPSIRGWTAASIYGYAIVCLPVHYINAKYLVPRLQIN